MSINEDLFDQRSTNSGLKPGQLIVPQSQKQDKNVLPDKQLKAPKNPYDYEEDSLFNRMKRNKILIGVIAGITLFVILLIVIMSNKSNTPNPPGPTPPGPGPGPVPGQNWNPYQVQDLYTYDSAKVYGTIKFDEALSSSFVGLGQNGIKANPHGIPTGLNNQVTKLAQFEIGQVDRKTAMINIQPILGKRYSPPSDVVNKLTVDEHMKVEMGGLKVFTNPFGFEFSDPSKMNEVILNTNQSNLVVMDKYLQLDLNLPSQRIYGLGERKSNFTLGEGVWTMWADGKESEFDDGKTGSGNSHGVHPFALVQTKTVGEYFGLFFRNTNAQAPIIKYKDHGESTLSYITTGGSIEIYVMLRGSAKEIIKRYHEIIGKPNLPPLWALGWHFQSGQFKTQTDVETKVEDYTSKGFPLESVFLDLPYMSHGQDFVIDKKAFPDLSTLATKIHNKEMKIIPRLDLGISLMDKNSDLIYQANYSDSLIQTSINSKPDAKYLTNRLHADETVYFDFFSETANGIWGVGIDKMYTEEFEFDGLWLESNEATTACSGECPDGKLPEGVQSKFSSFLGQSMDATNNTWNHYYDDQDTETTYFLPFIPGQMNLDHLTLSLNATHPSNNFKQFDTHNLMGHLQCRATFESMAKMTDFKDTRKFVLSSSTFAGSGKYAGHYLRDSQNNDFKDINEHVTGVMNFNMFGIPMTGPDICSNVTSGDPDQIDHCVRQVQLASFLPFARINQGALDQVELYDLPNEGKSLTQTAMYDKLRFSRLLYGCLFEANQNGETCIDPLFFHYPDYKDAYKNEGNEFIFANAIKVTPVTHKIQSGQETVSGFFTKGYWVDMHDFKNVKYVKEEVGEWIDVDATKDINAWMMPGTAIPYLPNDSKYNNTHDINLNGNVHILINRDDQGFAKGTMFFDTGIYEHEITDKDYEYYAIQHSGKSIKRWNKNTNPNEGKSSSFKLDKIIILNAGDVKDSNFACARDIRDGQLVALTATWSDADQTLTIAPGSGSIAMTELATIYYGNKDADPDICDSSSQFYKFQDDVPDITSFSASATLEATRGDHKPVFLELSVREGDVLSIRWNFEDPHRANKQFTVPTDVANSELPYEKTAKLSDYISINVDAGGFFYIDVKNKEGIKLYRLNGFALDRQFSMIQSEVYVDKTNFKGIMGLSDQIRDDLYLEDGVYTLWNRNSNSPPADGLLPGKNSHGSSPFYMGKGTDAKWFGVYHNTVAASDWWIFNDETQGTTTIDTYSVGGIGDIYIMFADTPDAVITKYQSIVGKPVLQPQWALGWHQSKYGYNNTQSMKDSMQRYLDFELPLDAQWADIDIMENFKSFTVDQQKFGDIKSLIDDNHKHGVKFVPIIDAGIAKRPQEKYLPYDEGVEYDVFIKNPINDDDPLIGNSWPIETVYPDWWGEMTESYWTSLLSLYRMSVPFDGIWLEMNEVESFCNGPCNLDQTPEQPVQNSLNYIPGGRSLDEQTISLDGQHQNEFLSLDTHNLFATMQTKATQSYFQYQGKQERGFVISRSGSQGIGQFGARQLGNNFSTPKYLAYSIVSIFQQSIAGVSMSGADICGFFGNTTADLCAQWYSIGAFYPFSRNHNNLGSLEQEPWSFQGDQLAVIRQSMINKLSLIRYYHTEMIKVSENGGTFFKPLFFEFPNDDGAYSAQTYNAMAGSALKLAFNSENITDTSEFYYPQGTWCNVITTANYSVKCTTADSSKNISMASGLGDTYAELRSNKIIPFQNVTAIREEGRMINNTENLKYESVDFLILPECNVSNCYASGDFYNDNDTTSNLTDEINKYNLTYAHDYKVTPNTFEMKVDQTATAKNHENNVVNQADALGKVKILNAKNSNIDVTVTYQVEAVYKDSSTENMSDAVYDSFLDILTSSENPHLKPLWLPYITSFRFTQKA